MTFDGPEPSDFLNVVALNRAYLALLRTTPASRDTLARLSRAERAAMVGLAPQKAERLAAVPFLLFSFRERDDELWERIFAAPASGELFTESAPSELERLRTAGLGFAWQLARRNPYALRLLCGATLHWCEEIAERTFLELLLATSIEAHLLRLRRSSDRDLWRTLLGHGVSTAPDVRVAAHMSALQTILTRPARVPRRRWAVAACRSPSGGLQVAED